MRPRDRSTRLPPGWWRDVDQQTLRDLKAFVLLLAVPALLLGILGVLTSQIGDAIGDTGILAIGVVELAIALPYLWWLIFRARGRLHTFREEIRQRAAAKGL